MEVASWSRGHKLSVSLRVFGLTVCRQTADSEFVAIYLTGNLFGLSCYCSHCSRTGGCCARELLVVSYLARHTDHVIVLSRASCHTRPWASDIGIGSLSVPFLCMYPSANSCVDRLNTEGGRDSASGVIQTADKRRKGATPAETLTADKQKQRERLRKLSLVCAVSAHTPTVLPG